MMKQMRRISGLLALAILLLAPGLALAAEQMGVYVAPKFVYGYTLMNKQGDEVRGDPFGYYAGKGNNSDDAFGGALAIGYDFNKKFRVPVRAEVEYSLFSGVDGDHGKTWIPGLARDTVKQKLDIQTLFANVYYDFRNKTSFTPYVGAGLGLSFIRSDGNFDLLVWNVSGWDLDRRYSLGTKSNTNFAWNVGAGVTYDFTNWFSLDLNYRFAGLGKAKTNNVGPLRAKTKEIYMHQVLLGLRATF